MCVPTVKPLKIPPPQPAPQAVIPPPPPPPEATAEAPVLAQGDKSSTNDSTKARANRRGTKALRNDLTIPGPSGQGLNVPR